MILFFYQLFFPLIGAAVLLKIAFAGRRSILREGSADLRQRLGRPSESDLAPLRAGKETPVVWLHAASVGEVMAAGPLLSKIARREKRPRVLMTTSTAAGRDRAARTPGIDAALLAPMDFYPAVAAFLLRVRPKSLILIETELWPMTLWLARKRGIGLGIANGRITERSFANYLKIRGFMSRLLSGFSRAALQTDADVERFTALGLPPRSAAKTGNVKYDQESPDADAVSSARTRLAELGWAGAPIWCAGSTRRGEEEQVLDAHRAAAKAAEGLRLILAPRHPERCGEVEALLKARGVRFVRWSQLLPFQNSPECLLVDKIGVLTSLYPASRAAFVGGSLVPVGGHNILEPALTGTPVLFGPHIDTVRSIAEALISSGGGRKIDNASGLAKALILWLTDPAAAESARASAHKTAKIFSGAAERTLRHLSPLL